MEKVAKRLGAKDEILSAFQAAKIERQFTKAIGLVRDAIPQALYMEGQNPLLLLHDALSEDLHAGTDESALEIAEDVRIILLNLSERIASVLENESQIAESVKRLIQRRQKK